MNLFNQTKFNCFDNKTEVFSAQNFIKELELFLEKPKSISYSIDRFEGAFAVCENRESLEMVNIPLSKLPKNINKSTILKFENNKYYIDTVKTICIKNQINYKSSKVYKRVR